MAVFEKVSVDVSSNFNGLAGTVIMTHIIREEGLPTAALIVDHNLKNWFIYEYIEGEISISLSVIEDDKVREQIEELIKTQMEREREA